MSADFEPSNKVWSLDLTLAKFTPKAPMKCERLMNGGEGAFYASNQNVYLLNGAMENFECEKYRPARDAWELVPSYSVVSKKEQINSWFGCLLREE